jgi:hypothetical protein
LANFVIIKQGFWALERLSIDVKKSIVNPKV